MFFTNCSKCDFLAESTAVIKSKKCPCCNSDLNMLSIHNVLENNDSLNSMIPKNEEIIIELDGTKLLFKEVNYESDREHLKRSTKVSTKTSKNGYTYQETIIDEFEYNLSLLALGLIADKSFNLKKQFLKQFFSRKQLDVLIMVYNSKIRDKYEGLMKEEYDKYIESTEAALADIAEAIAEENLGRK